MKKTYLFILLCLFGLQFASRAEETLKSPDGRLRLVFRLDNDGTPVYSLDFDGTPVVGVSKLGLLTADASANYRSGFILKKTTHSAHESVWAPVWGENDSIPDVYNAMLVELENPRSRTRLNIEFRAYDDGIGFRYRLPEPEAGRLTITDELTQFAMPGDLTAWWIPGDYDTQEYEYTCSRLSEIRTRNTGHAENISQHGFSPTGVQTSLLLKTDEGIYLNIHEAALVDYPAMHLNLDDENFVFTSWLTPDRDGNKAVITLPFSTPWRAVMVSDKATGILASNLILNLNEPCKLDDVSWIKPVKYMGVWWEMITGKSTWSYCDAENVDLAVFDYAAARPHGRHGANSENVMRYIDFAAEHGFDQLLVEGWNTGWEDWFGKEKEFVFDFITPYPDFDIEMLNRYAHDRGIRLMMHHETSGSIPNYEKQMDRAYELMNRYGYTVVKSGYVGNILPRGENHYNQNSVRHYLRCVTRAAERHIMVNGHEAVRPTGLCRTYPNLIGNESAMGTEYQNMSPGHATILPFTRLKGGPMDFTPGIFRTDFSTFAPGNTEHKRATTANQLALYVIMYSPLQMAADLPEHYAEKPDAFRFIEEVPVDWSRSLYLDAEPGAYIVAARKDKHSDRWFAGGITNSESRDCELALDFLDSERKYKAVIYRDGDRADCDTCPEDYCIKEMEVTKSSVLTLKMARGGGFALSITPKE